MGVQHDVHHKLSAQRREGAAVLVTGGWAGQTHEPFPDSQGYHEQV